MNLIALKTRIPWNKGIKTGPNPVHSLFMKNRTLSEETKQKISRSLKGIVRGEMSVEQREKISASKKGVIAGKKHPFFGKNHTVDAKKVMSINRTGLGAGEVNNKWKGDEVGYRALHRWVRRWKGAPTKCEHCGVEKTHPKSIHWANKSHEYKRVLEDWISLCVKCHKKYDSKNLSKTSI